MAKSLFPAPGKSNRKSVTHKWLFPGSDLCGSIVCLGSGNLPSLGPGRSKKRTWKRGPSCSLCGAVAYSGPVATWGKGIGSLWSSCNRKSVGPFLLPGLEKSNIETLWPSCFFPPLSKSRNGGDTGPIFPGCSRSSAAPVPFSRPGKKQSEVYGPSALCGVGKKQSEVCGQWLFPAFSSLEKQLRKKSLAWPLCHGFLWGRNLGPFLDLKIHQLRVQI